MNPSKKILQISGQSTLEKAAHILENGGLVAFPTETVYGLGADATNDIAVAKIYDVKKRDTFNPLIIHCRDLAHAKTIADFSHEAEELANQFWPGPLSLVLPKKHSSSLSELATVGLDTLAVRVPEHPVALSLLCSVPFPIAAPSANMSGSISPTTAQHVVDSLGDLISVVLEGGPCKKGIESTIIDMSEAQPTLLRSGSIPSEAIEEVFGLLLLTASKSSANPKSPGLLSRHYAPGLPMRLEVAVATDSEAFLGFGPDSAVSADLNLSPSGDLAEAAANLFAMLRQLDNPRNFKGIAVAPIPERGVGKAINDRLRRGSVRYSKNASQE